MAKFLRILGVISGCVLGYSVMAEECQLGSKPTRPQVIENGLIFEWTEPQHPKLWDLWSFDKSFIEILEFRESIISKIFEIDPFHLLKRQKDLYVKAFGEETGKPYDLVINKEVGTIKKSRCVDQLLLGNHLTHQKEDHLPSTSEFQAFIWSKGVDIKILQIVGFDITPPSWQILKKKLDLLKHTGWTLKEHIHNHPFMISNFPEEDIAGTTIPSGVTEPNLGDMAAYTMLEKDYGLEDSVIINGFHSGVYSKKDRQRFKVR